MRKFAQQFREAVAARKRVTRKTRVLAGRRSSDIRSVSDSRGEYSSVITRARAIRKMRTVDARERTIGTKTTPM